MGTIWLGLAASSFLAWLYLIFCRGAFWQAREQLPASTRQPARWPTVVAIIPARNEADVVGRAVASLLAQDYPRPLSIVVVDDRSEDATATVARGAGVSLPGCVQVISGKPLPDGWAGKVWAMRQGLAAAEQMAPNAEFLLFTDADIVHEPGNLRRLMAHAETHQYDLVSTMVRLQCEGSWARLLIPPFVFFFQKLYPFRWVNRPERRTAAAAGGCMLRLRQMLIRSGGIDGIADALIDGCALARQVKRAGGRLWLGLAPSTRSIRPYHNLGAIWGMVARSAYTQLNHSPWLLCVTVLAMLLIYLAPPIAVLTAAAAPVAGGFGLAAWLLMAAALRPTLRFYRLPRSGAFLLPVAAALYTLMTIDSAVRHWRGRGAMWKGRAASR